MNMNGLARHYDKLTPWERVPLMIAALQRGDEAECDRLGHSAPKDHFSVPDFHALYLGISLLTDYHMMRQLELAACYRQAVAVSADCALFADTDEDNGAEDRFWTIQRMLAFRLVTCADAWRHFCIDLGIDPDALLSRCPGFETVKRAEQAAQLVAFTPAEALKCFREKWEAAEAAKGRSPTAGREFHIDTAEDVAKEMRKMLDRLVEQWS